MAAAVEVCMRAANFPALAFAAVIFVAAGGAAIAPAAGAQTAQPQATPPFMPGESGAQNGTPVIQTRDGGSPTRLESIAVPPKSGAPFTLTLETEWIRPMSDGGSQTIANKRKSHATLPVACIRSAGCLSRSMGSRVVRR